MMDALARRLGLRTQPTIFFVSAGLMVLFLIVLLLFPAQLNSSFSAGRGWIVTNLGWYFTFGVTAWLIMLLVVAFGPYGQVRLGRKDEPPQYSFISWFTMLFAGGIGTILMFWGVAEPITHFGTPPRAGVEPYSAEAATEAMNFSLYHLSMHTWAIFCLPGLAFAYFIHRYELPMRVSSVFYPLIKQRIYGPLGRSIDIIAILGTLFGVAVSIGLGTSQIGAGLNALFGWDNGVVLQVLIVAVLTAVATTSIVRGLDKGVKFLSNVNIGMAVVLMIFVFLFGGISVFLLREVFQTLGNYVAALPELMLWNDSLAFATKDDGWGWQGDWTVFYWAWTVSWAPFMGIFLARISKGRTVREFVLGVLFAPSLFTLVWFVIFGWSAMRLDGIGGSGGSISEVVAQPEAAMFVFFESFPATQLVQGFAVLIVAIFFATSSDSASLVVDMLCTGDGDPGPTRQRVFWGVSEGMLAALLIVLAGDQGLEALQQVITVVGLPMFTLMFVAGISLLVALRKERLQFVTEVRGIPPEAIAAGREAEARGEVGYDPEANGADSTDAEAPKPETATR